eukprot:3795677-Prymnesium_polylepis.1
MKAEVVFFDGDWLKPVSFTSVVPRWLKGDKKRRAVAIRKPPLPASDHQFWVSWSYPLEEGSGKATEDSLKKKGVDWKGTDPGIAEVHDQIILVVLKENLVEASIDELEALSMSPEDIPQAELGWLSTRISTSKDVLSIGGGPTCTIEAEAWLRSNAQLAKHGGDGRCIGGFG